MSKKCIQIWLEVQIYFQKKSLALNRLELREGRDATWEKHSIFDVFKRKYTFF
jgi:hypothetical protein